MRHDLLNGLGFHLSHQNLRGTCHDEFRWDDDGGYMPTQDPRVVFLPDASGQRPGIYTYL
ncbi:MAG: hypothetical protein JWM31_3743, partial [Solirubrobacterales bacterium]|nr:hypothetical protein [Solirubrobacterales bacterium]